MNRKKFKIICLSILSTMIISSTPVFSKTNTNSTIQPINSTISNDQNVKVVKSKISLKIYTYANAPADIRAEHEQNCKSVNKTPSPSDVIYVPVTNINDSTNSSLNVSSSSYDFLFMYNPSTGNFRVSINGTQYSTSIYLYVGYGHVTSGDPVYCAQAALYSTGYFNSAIDGIFGPKTQQAVLNFQSAHNLMIDGILGPSTWGSLINAL